MTDDVARRLALGLLCDMAQNTLLRHMEAREANKNPDDVTPSVALPDDRILMLALQAAYSQGVCAGIDQCKAIFEKPAARPPAEPEGPAGAVH